MGRLIGFVSAKIRSSAWSPIVLRLVAVTGALVTLAWIGRPASADPVAVASLSSPSADAGAPTSAAPPPPPLVAPPPPVGAPPPAAITARATPEHPVFVNHASVEELRRLPGVGPKRAEAIVTLRHRLGRFQRVEDLLRVKGVGRATVRKWRPLVRLDTPLAEVSTADAGSR